MADATLTVDGCAVTYLLYVPYVGPANRWADIQLLQLICQPFEYRLHNHYSL